MFQKSIVTDLSNIEFDIVNLVQYFDLLSHELFSTIHFLMMVLLFILILLHNQSNSLLCDNEAMVYLVQRLCIEIDT
jgi:hypothetical protein